MQNIYWRLHVRSKVVTALSWWITCPSGDQKEVLEFSWPAALPVLLPYLWRLYLPSESQMGTALVAQPCDVMTNQMALLSPQQAQQLSEEIQ
jgi:hypothetical protein